MNLSGNTSMVEICNIYMTVQTPLKPESNRNRAYAGVENKNLPKFKFLISEPLTLKNSINVSSQLLIATKYK